MDKFNYIPRAHDLKVNKDTLMFNGWIQGYLYMGSRHWEREGMPTFPKNLDYFSLKG
jgi:hypothetical protein